MGPDRPTPEPTKVPTKSPTSAPTKSPTSAPIKITNTPEPYTSASTCTFDDEGNYAITDSLSDETVEIPFLYEMHYDDTYDVGILLQQVERAIGEMIIRTTDDACRTDRRNLSADSNGLRQLSTSDADTIKGRDLVVGFSSKPADSFLGGEEINMCALSIVIVIHAPQRILSIDFKCLLLTMNQNFLPHVFIVINCNNFIFPTFHHIYEIGSICTTLPSKCKVVKGGFKIFRKKYEVNDFNDEEETQTVAGVEGAISNEEMEASFHHLIQRSMSGGSLSTSVPGIIRLHYRGRGSITAVLSSTDDNTTLKDNHDLVLIFGAFGVVVAFLGMLAVGTLMKRHRDRNKNNSRSSIYEQLGETNCLNGSQRDYPSSYWDRGWTNVTRTYDQAVEVCMQKVNSFRRDGEKVDSFRRSRNEFI